MRVIDTIKNEGFTCVIREDDSLRVFFTADGDIDADGANGQNGAPVAYKADNSGTEDLANGGMKIKNGKVICTSPGARDIVITGADKEPKIFPGGIIASKTWYKHPGKADDDPAAYVDAETVPYIVVPPVIINHTKGVVCGCKARVTRGNKSVDCVVADRGPKNKIGELSIAAARAIGLNASPRHGGTEQAELLYELWPGIAAPGFTLEPA